MNNQFLNEAVYLYSAMKANKASCVRRFDYWNTIHIHRAKALNKPSLVREEQAVINAQDVALLREQAL